MGRSCLSEFQELFFLAVASMNGEAFGAVNTSAIQQETGRLVFFSAVFGLISFRRERLAFFFDRRRHTEKRRSAKTSISHDRLGRYIHNGLTSLKPLSNKNLPFNSLFFKPYSYIQL